MSVAFDLDLAFRFERPAPLLLIPLRPGQNRKPHPHQVFAKLPHRSKSQRMNPHFPRPTNINLPIVHKQRLFSLHAEPLQSMFINRAIRLDQPNFRRKRGEVEQLQPVEILLYVSNHRRMDVREQRRLDSSAAELPQPTHHLLVGVSPHLQIQLAYLLQLRCIDFRARVLGQHAPIDLGRKISAIERTSILVPQPREQIIIHAKRLHQAAEFVLGWPMTKHFAIIQNDRTDSCFAADVFDSHHAPPFRSRPCRVPQTIFFWPSRDCPPH